MDKHELKILSKYFNKIGTGEKTFEVRKDDRDFKVGDLLILNEIDKNKKYTGQYISRTITYILGREENEKQYVADGYIIMGISRN